MKAALTVAPFVHEEVKKAVSVVLGTDAPVATPHEFWAADQLAVSFVLPPALPTQ